ncbi:YhgE/Pip family protein [Tepidibacillus sp. LV47]|uniref:YhgE/Pip family protein n=1 Tax=Tepidibacillus sp. LV47 TaxID=3398228 RepID=UPI003AAC9B1D
MNGIQCARNEFKRLWSNRFTRIAIIAVALMPLLYSSLYLWAFWDPYKNLEHLPVAVVNNDKGTVYEGKKLEVGKELVDSLKKEKDLDWHFVSNEEAINGLENEKYYLLIRIPKNFSEQIASVKSNNPVKPTIEYIPKESRNLLASQLGERAVEQLKNKVSEKLTVKYLDTLASAFGDIRSGFQEAADGAKQLHDGTNVVQQGVGDLHNGIQKAQNGAAKLVTGLPVLVDGAKQISQGLAKTAGGNQQIASGLQGAKVGLSQLKEKTPTLQQGLSKLTNGLKMIQTLGTKPLLDGTMQVNQGLNKLQTGIDQLHVGSQQATTGMVQVQTSINQLVMALDQGLLTPDQVKEQLRQLSQGMNPIIAGQQAIEAGLAETKNQIPKLIEGQTKVADGLKEVDQQLNTAQTGAKQIESGFQQYSSGIGQLYDGITKAEVGVKKIGEAEGKMAMASTDWVNGVQQAVKGAYQLNDGLLRLSDGSSQLESGLSEIEEGAGTLYSKLKEGAEKIKEQKPTDQQLAQMVAPLEIITEKINPIPNYGTGFAPYFISLALWVGALVLFFVIDVHAIDQVPLRTSSWVLGKYVPLVFIGSIQAIISSFVLQFILGLNPNHPVLFYFYNILLSMTFIAVIQGLVSILGDAGRFLAIVLLMLQLTSSAGTFPLELTPRFFQNISPYLPMTYSVKGLKEIISANNMNTILHTVYVLLFIAFGAFITTVILAKGKINYLKEQQRQATVNA